MAYHEGELEVQQRAGVAAEAVRVGRIIGDVIPPAARQFLEAQPFVIVSSIDERGAVWASLVTGAARAEDERTVLLTPTGGNRVFAGDVGLLAIDFATRRRMRVNGRARLEGNRIVIETREVYSNCPQYIHPRPGAGCPVRALQAAKLSTSLTAGQQDWIRSADTFFIATAHPTAGADASHRGGEPGFVRTDAHRIAWPDFHGNNMFNTLGNLAVNPRCGLLFTDFQRTLQVSGSATIHWNGTARAVEVAVEQVVEC